MIWKRLRAVGLATGLSLLFASVGAWGQNYTATVNSTSTPQGVAVNPITNTVYVVNTQNVTVINGITNVPSTVTDANATTPYAVAVNPLTNTAYVANNGSGNVTVITGTSYTTTVSAGTNPRAIAVDPVTNMIFVGNSNSGNVTVINGATNSSSPVTVGTTPDALAVNPATGMVYVANAGTGNVSVISEATDTVVATITVQSEPTVIAVNPATNTVYVGNTGSSTISVIDGSSNTVTTTITGLGSSASSLAINPTTNTIYATLDYPIAIINGSNNTFTTVSPLAESPIAAAVDVTTNKIYIADYGSGNVTVLDGISATVVGYVQDPNAELPQAVAVNPVTDKIYVANYGSSNVTVIDGATNGSSIVPDDMAFDAVSVDVNPVTGTAYMASSSTNNVTVITGTSYYATVSVGTTPAAVAVNPVTNQVYVANSGSDNVTVIDGSTDVTTTVQDPNATSPVAVAVNPVTNLIYVANQGSNNVTMIDGGRNVTTLQDPNAVQPVAIAVNPATDTIYVANEGSSNVSVFVGSQYVSTVQVGTAPVALAVDPVSNMVYVANYGGNNVTVINGATEATSTINDSNESEPTAVAVNPVTGFVYVANYGVSDSSPSSVTAINESNDTYTDIYDPNISSPKAIAVNEVTNKIYVANDNTDSSGNTDVTVIDGATGSFADVAPVSLGDSVSVAVDRIANNIYVANSATDPSSATIITEQPVQPVPITTTITPLTNNLTASQTPILDFAASNSLNSLGIDNLLYQVDSWLEPWNPGSSLGSGNYDGTSPSLLPGFHIAYAFATDSEEATATDAGIQTMPLIGNIAAYGFLVAAPAVSPSPSSLSYGDQAVGTSSASALNVNNIGSANLVLSGIGFTGTNPGDFSETDNCSSAVTPGNFCTINVTFAPTATGGRSASLSLTDNNNDVTGSVQSVALAGMADQASTTTTLGSSPNPSVYGQMVTYTATITPQGTGSPGGTVQFTDGETTLCSAAPVTSNQATCPETIETLGSHSITAVYSGDINFTGSTSTPVLSQVVNPANSIVQITANTPNPSALGQGVSVSFTVGVAAPGGGTIPGTETVTVSDTTGASCSATVSAGSCILTPETPGSDTLTARYPGDADFNSNSSAGTAQSVGTSGTTTKITASSVNPSVFGQSIVVSFALTVSGSIPATGTVTVTDSTGATCSATVSAGSCSLTPKAVGADTLTAVYSGDSNYTTSTSAGVGQTVNPAATTAKVTASSVNPTVFGQPTVVSFAVTVNAPGSGTILGTDTVTVTDSTGATCSATVSAGSCALTPKAVGADTFTATYAGDSDFSASTSAGAAQTVDPAATTTTITALTPAAPSLGQPLTVSYTVAVDAPGVGTIPGTDTVTVTDGSGATCTGTVAAGKCTLTPEAAGTDSLKAAYNGDANFGKSTGSSAAPFTISQSVNLTGLAATTSPDQPTSLGVSLSAPATTQLTGTLSISFVSSAYGTPAGYIDPMTCFINSSGQCVTQLDFTVPVGATTVTLPNRGMVQQGTTAGTITISLTALSAGTTSVLPNPAPSISVVVPPLAPVLKSVSIVNETSTGFSVQVVAYSTPRNLQNLTLTFGTAAGTTLNGTNPPAIDLSAPGQGYFSSSGGVGAGGSFTLTVPFSFNGNISAIGNVSATLSNSVGASSALTGNVQ